MPIIYMFAVCKELTWENPTGSPKKWTGWFNIFQPPPCPPACTVPKSSISSRGMAEQGAPARASRTKLKATDVWTIFMSLKSGLTIVNQWHTANTVWKSFLPFSIRQLGLSSLQSQVVWQVNTAPTWATLLLYIPTTCTLLWLQLASVLVHSWKYCFTYVYTVGISTILFIYVA